MQIQKPTESLGNTHLNLEKHSMPVLKSRLEKLFQPVGQHASTQAISYQDLPVQNQTSMLKNIFQQLPQPVQFTIKITTVPFQAGFIIATYFMEKSIAFIESVISRILPFFFGFKKDRTEERYIRDKDDFAATDLFTRRVVEETTNDPSE